jgi:3'-5' exoribonuclease
MKEPINYRRELFAMAASLNVERIASELLNNYSFLIQSGSQRKRAHHYGAGGLLKHTWEVCSLVLQNATFYLAAHPNLDLQELFISALYHDYGKVWDYERDPVTLEYSEKTHNNHRRRIHHISRSAIEWEVIARKLNIDKDFTERVTHNILSHHGQREWGSPVAPLSREAWILHLCDGISARVDDCDRVDLATVKGK